MQRQIPNFQIPFKVGQSVTYRIPAPYEVPLMVGTITGFYNANYHEKWNSEKNVEEVTEGAWTFDTTTVIIDNYHTVRLSHLIEENIL